MFPLKKTFPLSFHFKVEIERIGNRRKVDWVRTEKLRENRLTLY